MKPLPFFIHHSTGPGGLKNIHVVCEKVETVSLGCEIPGMESEVVVVVVNLRRLRFGTDGWLAMCTYVRT